MELIKACGYGKLDQVVELLKTADPSSRDNQAIHLASEWGHVEVVKLLLKDERVDPGADDNYAIRWASLNGHVEVVRLLLREEKVDPSSRDNQAIEWASWGGHIEVVKLLLQDKRVRTGLPEELKHLTNEYYKEVYAVILILQKKVHPDLTKQIVLFVYDL
jgi:ankyrin repeat protein